MTGARSVTGPASGGRPVTLAWIERVRHCQHCL